MPIKDERIEFRDKFSSAVRNIHPQAMRPQLKSRVRGRAKHAGEDGISTRRRRYKRLGGCLARRDLTAVNALPPETVRDAGKAG